MSKFFGGASEGDSSDASADSDVEQRVEVPEAATGAGAKEDFFAVESSDEEDEKRVILTEKDKRVGALRDAARTARNHMNIMDCVSLRASFENIVKLIEKSKKVFDQEKMPKFVFRILADMEDLLNEIYANRSSTKLSKASAKVLSLLRQRVKKHNRDFADDIEAYRQDPDEDTEDDEPEDFAESDSDASSADEDSDEESEEGAASEASVEMDDQSDESDSSDDESDIDEGDVSDMAAKYRTREYWTIGYNKKKATDKLLGAVSSQNQEASASRKEVEQVAPEEKKEIDYTPAVILENLGEILALRGKRNVDRNSILSDIEFLLEKCNDLALSLKLRISLLSSLLDFNLNKTGYMKAEHWKKATELFLTIIKVLMNHPKIRLTEKAEVEETIFAENSSLSDKTDPKASVQYVSGNLRSFLSRFSDEFMNAMQEIDPHSEEYVDRLADEITVLRVAAKVQKYYERMSMKERVLECALLRVEYLYPKYVSRLDVHNPEFNNNVSGNVFQLEDTVFHRLCRFLLAEGGPLVKTRVTLSLVYNHCIHNNFFKARDLFLMSHVQEHITHADIPSKILYNRTLAHLGLCAFRSGFYRDAVQSISDLYSTGRIREILAQGVSHKYDTKIELLQLERSQQIPFHLHISMEYLDAVHVLSAMILEIPNIVVEQSDDRRFVISRNFRKQWDAYIKNPFNGSPETTRDCAMAASRALFEGRWREAHNIVMKMKMWSLITFPDGVREHVEKAIKETALKTFLASKGRQYATLSLSHLCSMYELDEETVYGISSKMMIRDQLEGVWDTASKCIIMHPSDLNSIQTSAMQLADKVSLLVDQNERLAYGKGSRERNTVKAKSLKSSARVAEPVS